MDANLRVMILPQTRLRPRAADLPFPRAGLPAHGCARQGGAGGLGV